VDKIAERINQRYHSGRGFVNIVIAEGAKPKEGTVTGSENDKGSEHLRLGGVAFRLSHELKKAGCQSEIRETVLGHIQRGGTPTAFDRVLATMFGVHAFELAKEKQFGRMVSFRNNQVISVPLEEATREMNLVKVNSQMVRAAKGIGISFGD
ncbi:MAG: 6-phosphofructokinase, partial [Candidatus Nephrothrix sp. EaCA]